MNTFTDNFSPNDFHALSIDIENSIQNQNSVAINSHDAAWLRSAISRTYYSAFLAVREEFLNSPTLRSRINNVASDHGVIKTELQRLPQNLFYLSEYFEDLRDYRNKADYDLPPEYEVNLPKVQLANQKAREILQKLSIIMQNL